MAGKYDAGPISGRSFIIEHLLIDHLTLDDTIEWFVRVAQTEYALIRAVVPDGCSEHVVHHAADGVIKSNLQALLICCEFEIVIRLIVRIAIVEPPRPAPLITPDGRYLFVRGRLWRLSNPNLSEKAREKLVSDLMNGRRAVAAAIKLKDKEAKVLARATVDRAKHALGERGPVWWMDGEPDRNRPMIKNTPYAAWFVKTHQV